MSKWIKMKDKHPPVGERVLVLVESEEDDWKEVRIDKIYEKNGKKYWEELFSLGSLTIKKWQPLPPTE